MKERMTFWDKNAGRYDRFMRKDRAAYEEMYTLIRPVVKAKTLLELATGTGLIAKHIVNTTAHIEATDASATQAEWLTISFSVSWSSTGAPSILHFS